MTSSQFTLYPVEYVRAKFYCTLFCCGFIIHCWWIRVIYLIISASHDTMALWQKYLIKCVAVLTHRLLMCNEYNITYYHRGVHWYREPDHCRLLRFGGGSRANVYPLRCIGGRRGAVVAARLMHCSYCCPGSSHQYIHRSLKVVPVLGRCRYYCRDVGLVMGQSPLLLKSSRS